MGKPVVATNIRGCREAVDPIRNFISNRVNNKTGILIPVRNPGKLSEAIIYLLENPKIAEKMGQEGRKKALREFDEDRIFERINKEYQRLIKEKL